MQFGKDEISESYFEGKHFAGSLKSQIDALEKKIKQKSSSSSLDVLTNSNIGSPISTKPNDEIEITGEKVKTIEDIQHLIKEEQISDEEKKKKKETLPQKKKPIIRAYDYDD